MVVSKGFFLIKVKLTEVELKKPSIVTLDRLDEGTQCAPL